MEKKRCEDDLAFERNVLGKLRQQQNETEEEKKLVGETLLEKGRELRDL